MGGRNAALLALFALLAPTAGWAYNAVDSPDGVYVLAVGDSGRMARSWNGGTFWSSDTLGIAHLNALEMRGEIALLVDAEGCVSRSADAGGSWTARTGAGAALLALDAAPDLSLALAVGLGGRVLRSSDAGLTWQEVASGTPHALRAVRITGSVAWAAGDAGTLLRSDDAGATWNAVNPGTGADLLAVDAAGADVWVTGRGGVAYRSGNGGAGWSRVDLGLPHAVDVDFVRLAAPDTVWLAGGGGFVRRSVDGGATWTFTQQPAFAAIGAIRFMPGHAAGWAALREHGAVLSTDDGGLSWTLPAGTADQSAWRRARAYTGSVRGSTIQGNALAPDGLFAAVADSAYRSSDRGRTWQAFAQLPPATKTNAFIVSPYDTLTMVAAIGEPDRIVRSSDGGQSWAATLVRDFSEFGTPLEMDAAHPETLLFAPENGAIYRSTDFGATWDSLAAPGFRSPCDIQIVPGDPLNVWLGDGITNLGPGEIHQSLDGGFTWTLRFSSALGSEIPALAVAPLEPTLGIATQWSNGGVVRTEDGGETWSSVSAARTAWGAAFAPDDPGAVTFGLFATGSSFFSTNRGSGFTSYALPSSNYSIYAIDRAHWLGTQSDGIYRFVPAYAQPFANVRLLTLDSPNGGESWTGGETREIRWTSFNLYRVVLEFSPDFASGWIPIDTVAAYAGRYEWTIPAVVASSARVRVRNLWDAQPADESNAAFTISSSFLTFSPGILDVGGAAPGDVVTRAVTIGNPGNLPLDVLGVTPPPTAGPIEWWAARSSFTIPAGGSDTLGVSYRPSAVGRDTATFTIAASDPDSPHALVVVGEGLPAAFTALPIAPNPVRDRSLIRYALPVAAKVRLEIYNLQGQRVATLVDGHQPPGEYAAAFGPGVPMGSGAGRAALPPGVYFYRFRAGPLDVQRKIVLLR